MILLSCLTFSVLSILICYQDYQSRSIHLWLLSALGILGIFYWVIKEMYSVLDLLLNGCYLFLMLGLSFAVMYVKGHSQWRKIIGIGDLFYLLIMVFYFGFPAFPFLITLSFVITLILHFVFSQCVAKYRQLAKIPLAGFQSPVLALALVYDNYVRSISTYFY